MTKRNAVLSLGTLLLSLALAACGQTAQPALPGNTGTTGNTGPSGYTGTLDGTLSALSSSYGSFQVGGQTVTLGLSSQSLSSQGTGTVRVNGEPSSREALAAGQHVHAEVKDGQATSVEVAIEVRGKVESVDVTGGTLTVAGQRVAVSSDTRISLGDDESRSDQPAHTLAELAAVKDAMVEVTGSRDSSGVIQATRIEVRSAQQREKLHLNDAEVAGKISALDAAAKTFVVNGVSVAYGAATLQGDALSVGAGVEVRGAYDDALHVLNAVRVGVHSNSEHQEHLPPAGAHVRIEGAIVSVDAAAKTLSLGGFTVDLSAATVSGTPTVGALVHVNGTTDSVTPTLIHAATVTISAAGERRFEGTLSNLAGSTFDLGQLHVDASHATTAGTLTNGQPVVVFGHLSGESRTLIAVRVLGTQPRSLTGTVRDLDAAHSSFRMGDFRVSYANAEVSGVLRNGAGVTLTGTPGQEGGETRALNATTVTVQ